MSNITPFKIDVSEAKLQRLKQKLALADFPDEVEGVGWDRGSPLADIKRLTEYWREGYDWRKAEKKLNELPQFTADVEVEGFGALNVHFVHQKSEVENAIPLIFVHGWPGSFDEVSKILPELVKGGDDHPAFHVVAPSLLNFGFSQGVTKVSFSYYTRHLLIVVDADFFSRKDSTQSTKPSHATNSCRHWVTSNMVRSSPPSVQISN